MPFHTNDLSEQNGQQEAIDYERIIVTKAPPRLDSALLHDGTGVLKVAEKIFGPCINF